MAGDDGGDAGLFAPHISHMDPFPLMNVQTEQVHEDREVELEADVVGLELLLISAEA
jgi:hypothetical protein